MWMELPVQSRSVLWSVTNQGERERRGLEAHREDDR